MVEQKKKREKKIPREVQLISWWSHLRSASIRRSHVSPPSDIINTAMTCAEYRMEKPKVLESAGNFQVDRVSAASATASREPTTTSNHAVIPRATLGCENSPGCQGEPQPWHGEPHNERAEVEGLLQHPKWRQLVGLLQRVLLKQGPGVVGLPERQMEGRSFGNLQPTPAAK